MKHIEKFEVRKKKGKYCELPYEFNMQFTRSNNEDNI